MTTRWSHSPHGGVRRVTEGPSRAASVAGALLAITGTTLALLIIGAMLLPGPGGSEDPAVAVAASPTPVVRDPGSVAIPTPRPSGAPVASPADPAPAASGAPSPTVRPSPSAAPSTAPVQVAFRSPAPVTQGGREVGRVTVQAIRQVKGSTAVRQNQRLMIAEVQLDARLARLPYDELQFRLEDDSGDRYEPVTDAAPEPLGSGTLAPSAERSGQVAFAIPKGRKAVAVVLTDETGTDLVVFSRAQPTS
jgi:hypothetical protein